MTNKGSKSSKFKSKKYLLALAVAAVIGSAGFNSAQRAAAGVFTWNGSSSALWSTAGNWTVVSGIAPPGTGDTATFNTTSANTTIDLTGGVTVNTILFDTNTAAAYTIGAGAVGSQTLTLNSSGAVTMNSTVANNELFNAALILGTDATAQNYTFTNNSTTNSLTFAGKITGGSGGTAGLNTLTLAGAGNISIGGIIANGGTTSLGLTKSGLGTLTLSGANTYTGATILSQGTLLLNSNTTADTTGYTLGDANTGANNIVLKIGAGFNSANTSLPALGTVARLINVNVSSQGSGTATVDVSASGTNPDLVLVINRATILKGPKNQLFNTISGPGAGAGNDSLFLDVNGGGFTWTSNGTANTFTGNVHIINSSGTAGLLNMQNNSYVLNDAAHQNLLIPDTASVTIDPNVTLSVVWGDETIDALNGSGTAAIIYNGGTTFLAGGSMLTVGAGNGSGTFSGTMNSGGFTFGKTGTGTEELSGTGIGYTGATTLTNGTLLLTKTSNFASAITMNASNTVTLQLNSVLATDAWTLGTVVSGGSGSASVQKVGLGTVTLTGSNTYTGNTSINAGVLNVGVAETANVSGPLGKQLANAAGTIIFGGGTLQYSAANHNDYSGRFSTAASQPISIDTNSQNVIFATALTSSGGTLTKLGAGTLTLTGSNTYTGNTTINGGVLNLGVAESANVSGPLGKQLANAAGTIIFGGGTLQYSAANQFDYSGRFSTAASQPISIDTNSQNVTFATAVTSSSGTLTKLGAGTLSLTASNTYTGGTTISAGTLLVSGTGVLGGGTYSAAITDNGSLIYASSANQTLGGIISGTTGTLVKSGTSTLTLSGANSYGGSTTLSQGMLILNSNTTADGTGYTLGDANTGVNNIVLKLGSGFNSGNASLPVVGGVRLINVTVTNQGSGTTTIDFSGSPAVNPDLSLVINRATILKGPYNQLYNTISGPGAGAGNDSLFLDVNGGGFTWTSNGTASTFTGNVHIINSSGTAGTLNMQNNTYIANDAAHQNLLIPDTASVTIDPNVTLSVVWGDETIDALNGSGSAAIGYNGGTTFLAGGSMLTVGAGNGSGIFSGTMNSGGFTFGKTGTGTQTLSGTGIGYTGATTLTNGTLLLTKTSNFASAITMNASNTVTLQLNSALATDAWTMSKIISGGSVNASVQKIGLGTVTLTGSNTYSGNTSINGGVLNMGVAETANVSGPLGMQLANAAGTIIFGGGTLQYSAANQFDYSGRFSTAASQPISIDTNSQSVTFATALTSSGGMLTKLGAGTLTLTGSNTYTGGTTVSAGVLNIQNATALGTTATGTSVSNGATLQIQGGITVGAEALTLNGGNASGQAGALVNVSGTNTYGGAITIASSSTIAATAGSILNLTGGIIKNATTLTLSGGTINISGTGISGSSAHSDLIVSGSTVTLSATNTYNGPTTIQSSGVINLGASNVFPTSPQTDLTINSIGTLNINGFSDQVASLSGDNTGFVDNAGATNGTLTINTTGSNTFAGIIKNTGTGTTSIIMAGTGTQTLTGANTYSGGTTISSGVLSVGSASNLPAASTLTLSGGGALNMTANMTLANNVILASGQTGLLRMVGATNGTLSGNYSGVAGTLTLDVSGGSGFSGFVLGSATGPALGSVINIVGAVGQNVQINAGNSADQAFFANSKVSFATTVNSNIYFAAGNGSATNISFGALDGGVNSTGGLNGTLIGFDNRTGTVTITGTTNGNFAGTIFNGQSAGPLTLIKNGSSTQTLSGTNTYTGQTLINAGKLNVTGSLASGSAVTVGTTTGSATATLSGSGTINGALTVIGTGGSNTVGHLAPSGFTGSSGTTMTLGGAVTLNTGSVLDFNLNSSTSTGNDLLSITGTGAVNYGTGGVLNINAYNGGTLALGNYVLFNDASSTTPTGAPAGPSAPTMQSAHTNPMPWHWLVKTWI